MSEEARGELEKQTELLKKALVEKDKEIKDANDRLRQAKEEAIHEYCDSDALLAELGGPFAEGFDDCLRQVKASYPVLTLMLQPQPPFSPSYLRVRMSYLLMMFLAVERKLKLRTLPVTLLYKRRSKRILLFSNSFFFFVNILVEQC